MNLERIPLQIARLCSLSENCKCLYFSFDWRNLRPVMAHISSVAGHCIISPGVVFAHPSDLTLSPPGPRKVSISGVVDWSFGHRGVRGSLLCLLAFSWLLQELAS